MATPDWETIKQIFSEALNVPPAVRDAYLERACGGRTELYHAVTDLLRAHSDASQSFLEPDSIVVRAAWLFAAGEPVGGRFRVVKPIARGAMGEVYHVHDERLRLDVALKAIRPELLADTDSVERFRREILVTRDIAHDGLCRVFDLVEHTMPPAGGFPAGTVVPCLTMQLLDGINLEDWLSAHRPMTSVETLPVITQIAEALQVLHDAGVVHRDLKPSNVMLVTAGSGMRAVLTDFGLAKPLDEGLFETQRAVHGGAPYFMAPELFRGERPSKASDIYALGLLIDEMVTTSRAFSADSLHSLLLQKLGDGPALPSARSTAIPPAWEQTILRCLAPDPRDRHESALAVLGALNGEPTRLRWTPRRLFHAIAAKGPRRVALYAAVAGSVLTAAAAVGDPRMTLATTGIAIRPFTNSTKDPELAYLAIGTAGELGRRLSRISTIRVHTGTDGTGPQLAAVKYAVEGHIQEANQQLRITVQLKDFSQGTLVWSQRFDGSRSDALLLEDQLAAETVGAIARQPPSGTVVQQTLGMVARLVLRSPGPLPSSGTSSSAAFDAYLRGRTLFEERTVQSALQAIEYLKKAVKEDPNYAAAYATLADVQGVLMDYGYAPHSTLVREAERYVDQAVALDPNLPDVQLSLASVRQMQWRWNEAEAAYKRAIDLHPTSARAHRWYGGLLLQFGRFEEALERHRHALELDPSDFPSQSAYGHALFHAGRAREAAAQLERLLERKDLLGAHVLLGQIYSYLASIEAVRRTDYLGKALSQSELVREQESARDGASARSDFADMIAALAWSYQGRNDAAAPFVGRVAQAYAEGRVSPGVLARIYAVQRDVPKAMAALLDAEVHQDRELYYINVSPTYAGIRGEPQFRALVARLGLDR